MSNRRNKHHFHTSNRLNSSFQDKGITSLLSILLCLRLATTLFASLEQSTPLHPHVSGRLLVRPALEAAPEEITNLLNDLNAQVIQRFPRLQSLQLWQLGEEVTVQQALTLCLNSGLFDLAEPDYLIHSTELPNDPSFTEGNLWHLSNNGRLGGTRNADISATDAWSIRNSAESIIVAIIDTGALTSHEDLRDNLWRNPNEIAGNQIDDDQNGFVDDIHGINAIRDTGDPADDAGHGTHVAGILGAVGNNGIGTTGVAWQVQLMPLRFLDRFGEGATSDAIQCINYAIDNGAKVINTSWGSNAFSGSLNGAISLALQADIIIVAAAGNERRNNDVIPLYPASYTQNNVISVAATTNRDGLAGYSNYGAKSVDLAAPGDAILSTWHSSDQAYQTTSGTSMSSPIVAGAVALMRAHFPNATGPELVSRLLATTDPLPGLRGRCVSEGRLNLALSLGPDLIAGFSMTPTGGAPPLQVSFEDRSLGDVANWSWDFGDGQSSRGIPNPKHTYNRAGNFPVTLKIESAEGFSVSRSQSIPILANYRVELDFFNWITIDNPTSVSLEDNEVSAAIQLPFLFSFYARAHDEIFIGSNGILGFVPDELSSALNQAIPDAAGPNAIICAYWDNLDPSEGGQITYGTVGTAPNRKFVITWDDVPLAGGNTPLTFQAIIEETTQRIVFQYLEIHPGSSSAGGSGATVGLENHGGFLSAKHLFNGNRNLRNEQTIAFTPLSSNGMIVGPERDLQAIREQDGVTAMSLSEFQLLNTGSDPIGWQASSDQEWALLSKAQGILGAGQAEAVGVRINPTAANLAPGSYFATIQFRNLSTGTGSVDRRLHLVINGTEANWAMSPETSLAASGSQGGPFSPLSRIYTILNTGDRLIEWATGNSADWIDIEPAEGILGASVSETISVRFNQNVNNLRPGVHETTLAFSSQTETVPTLRTTSRLVIQGEASALVLLPDEGLNRELTRPLTGAIKLYEFILTNEGSETGTWTADLSQARLSLAPNSGSLAPGGSTTITVTTTEAFNALRNGLHTSKLILRDGSNSASTAVERFLSIQISPARPLSLEAQFEAGAFTVQLSGPANTRYLVETSSDLEVWQSISTIQTSNLGKATYRPGPTESASAQFVRFRPETTP